MGKNYERRKMIFLRYAENLHLYRKAIGETMSEEINGTMVEITYPIYICPLCLRIFRLKAIEGENPPLTLEHVPPDSLGGSAKVLTCKKCNNKAGDKLDIAINEALISFPFLSNKPGSSIKSKFLIEGKRFQGNIVHKQEKEFLFKFNDNYNTQNLEGLTNYLGGASGQINFTFSVPSTALFNKAVLRVAYLQTFAIFGYSYLYNKNTEKIRRFLNDESPQDNPPVNMLPLQFTADTVGIHLLRAPEEISNYLLVIPFKTKTDVYYLGVVIPGSEANNWQNYINFHDRIARIKADCTAAHLHSIPIALTQLEGYNGIIDDKMRVGDFYTLWTTHQ